MCHEILLRLTGQTQYEVGSCINSALTEIIYAIYGTLVRVMTIYQFKSAVNGGFYSNLQKKVRVTLRSLASETLLKPIGQIRLDAVGAGGNDQTFYAGILQRLLI